jgi:hypothetical protein
MVFRCAISFAPFITRPELAAALRLRVQRAVDERLQLAEKVKIIQEQAVSPPHVAHAHTLDIALLDAEIVWLSDYLELVDAGALEFAGEQAAGDVPGASGWAPPPEDSGWEMAAKSEKYRLQIAALSTAR